MTDRAVSRRPLEEAIAEAVAAGVDWVQVRERGLDAAALLALARRIVRAARAAAAERAATSSVRVVVNRRVDVALALGRAVGASPETGPADPPPTDDGVDGVHLGFDAMSVPDARRLLGPHAFIGVSTHGAAELADAAASGASYAQLAPIFAPRSKPAGRPALGVDALRAAIGLGLPVLAQGGIEAGNACRAIEAGAAGVAVTGAILMDAEPGAAAAALRAALDAARPAR